MGGRQPSPSLRQKEATGEVGRDLQSALCHAKTVNCCMERFEGRDGSRCVGRDQGSTLGGSRGGTRNRNRL
jgi:hypothetical protein